MFNLSPQKLTGEKNFDLTQLMMDTRLNIIGLSETSRHLTSLPDEDRTHQRFRGHFMRQNLDTTTSCNEHNPFLGSFQYGGTASLSTGNLISRNAGLGRYTYGLGR